MRKISKEAKASWCLFIICWIVYAVISMSKNAFSASIASIVQEGLLNKADSGLINAGFYLFYGGAQLVFFRTLDRVSPIKLITVVMVGTIASLLGMSMVKNFISMLLLWSFCGLIQFSVWPAVLRLMSEYLLPEHEGFAHVAIAFSYCTGSLTNYLLAAFILRNATWRVLFCAVAGIATLILLLWLLITYKTVPCLLATREPQQSVEIEKTSTNTQTETKKGLFPLLLSSGVLFILVVAFCRAMLDSGLKAWVPTMIVENYPVSVSFATVLTTVLMFVNLFGVFISRFFYPKIIKSAVRALSLCFVTVVPFLVLLLWTGEIAVALVVLALTVITTIMYAGHQLQNVIIPSRFSKIGREGSVSSVLNAFASFGIVVANFSFGFMAEHFGWQATITSWLVIAAVAFVFATLAAPLWKRFFTERGEKL
jgi:sugar phosphate permease